MGQEGKVGRMTQIITDKQKLLVGLSGKCWQGTEVRWCHRGKQSRRPGTGCVGHVGSRERQVPITWFSAFGESNGESE